jgi:hypothetical protein
MRKRPFAPTSWVKVGLAILPGLFALSIGSDLFRPIFGVDIAESITQNGLIAVCILLIIAGLVRERRIAVWSFPAFGIALIGGWLWIPPPFVRQTSPFWQFGAPVLILAVLAAIGGFAVYHVYRQHSTCIPRLAWVLLGLVMLLVMAGVVTSTIADRSANKWTALRAMLPLTLWWTGLILSPVAIGLLLARRDGLLAGIIVVAAEFVLVDGLFDPGYALGMWTSNQTIVEVVSVVPIIFFLVVSPIWVLRSRSTRGRVWALLLPVFVGLVGAEIITGSVRPQYLGIWPTRAIGAALFLMAVALVAVMYHRIEGQGPAASIREGREL